MNLGHLANRLRVALTDRGMEGRLAADDLRLALRDPSRLDLRSFTAVVDALGARGHRVAAKFVPAPLGPGETWLLLAAGERGEAWRIRASVEPSPLDGAVQARPLADFPGEAVEALNALFRVKPWSIPDTCIGVTPRYHALPSSIVISSPEKADGLLASAVELHGRSLDLAAAVSLTSAWMRHPPRGDVAGTAALARSGTLLAVDEGGLVSKLRALAECWPGVRRVVVAAGQPIREVPATLELVPCANLDEALQHFFDERLDLRFPPLDPHQAQGVLAAMPHLSGLDLQSSTWSEHSRRAEAVAEALAKHVADDPSYRGPRDEALGFAIHFAVAAGDLGRAEALLARVPEDEPDGTDDERLQARVAVAITRAAHAINALEFRAFESPVAKREAGARAVELARAADALAALLPMTDLVSRRLRGRALGTLGRAHLHAGESALACEVLHRSATYHAERFPPEAPRSMCYLATAQRRVGRPEDALGTADAAVARTRRIAVHASALRFLHLERGRCFLDLSRDDDALLAFEAVLEGGGADNTYPRLGALRGARTALTRLDRRTEAQRYCERCMTVADDASTPEVFRKIAALALADEYLERETRGLPAGDLRLTLEALFGEGFNSNRAVELIGDAVY